MVSLDLLTTASKPCPSVTSARANRSLSLVANESNVAARTSSIHGISASSGRPPATTIASPTELSQPPTCDVGQRGITTF
eukprot:7577341-Lingulodinium_polyedra.AAC.1